MADGLDTSTSPNLPPPTAPNVTLDPNAPTLPPPPAPNAAPDMSGILNAPASTAPTAPADGPQTLEAAIQQLYGPNALQQQQAPQQAQPVHRSVWQGIMDALMPKVSYQMVNGKLTPVQQPETGGDFAKRVIAGALEGFSRAGAVQPGPGYAARAAAAGTGGGIQAAQEQAQQQRQQAGEDYDRQQQEMVRRAQMVMTAQNFMTQQLQYTRNKFDLEQAGEHANSWADDQIRESKMQDLGVVHNMQDIMTLAKQNPEVMQAWTQGRIFKVANYDSNRQKDGIRIAIRPVGQTVLDADLHVPIVTGHEESGKPIIGFRTIPKGSNADDSYQKLDLAQTDVSRQTKEWEQTDIERKRLEEEQKTGVVTREKDRAEAAQAQAHTNLLNTQARAMQGGSLPGGRTVDEWMSEPVGQSGTRENYVANLPEPLRSRVMDVVSGAVPYPTSMGRGGANNPSAQMAEQIRNAIAIGFPGYRAGSYQQYNKTYNDFVGGASGKGLQNLDVALQHIQMLYGATGFASQTPGVKQIAGYFGNQKVADFNNVRDQAIQEIHHAYDNHVISKPEMENMESQLNSWSPWKEQANLKTLATMLGDKIRGQVQTWQRGTAPGAQPNAPFISQHGADAYKYVTGKDLTSIAGNPYEAQLMTGRTGPAGAPPIGAEGTMNDSQGRPHWVKRDGTDLGLVTPGAPTSLPQQQPPPTTQPAPPKRQIDYSGTAQ